MVDCCKFTPFGLCVKTELLRRGKSQKWLEEEVKVRTGKFLDSGYLYKILTGRRNAPKIVQAIREILDMPPTLGLDERGPDQPLAPRPGA